MEKSDAKEALKNKASGTYLLRKSAQFDNYFALALTYGFGLPIIYCLEKQRFNCWILNLFPRNRFEDAVTHYLIRSKDGKYYLKENTFFPSLKALIEVRSDYGSHPHLPLGPHTTFLVYHAIELFITWKIDAHPSQGAACMPVVKNMFCTVSCC
jgi:hypothetical protein